MELFARYIIDTNIVIDITRRIYPPNLRDEARQIVERLILEGKITSHREVLEELETGAKPGDAALPWTTAHGTIFQEVTAAQEDHVKTVLSEHPGLVDADKTGPDADPWIVALALEIGGVVVTGDGSTGRSGKTQIKDVCDAYGIRCIDVETFLRENGWLSADADAVSTSATHTP